MRCYEIYLSFLSVINAASQAVAVATMMSSQHQRHDATEISRFFSAAETTVPCNSNLTSCWQPTTHLLWLLSRLPASSWNTGKKLRRKCYIVKMRKLWPSLNSLFLGYVTASCVASLINQLTVLASASNCCIRSRIFQSLFFNRLGLLGYWLCFMGHVAWYKRF